MNNWKQTLTPIQLSAFNVLGKWECKLSSPNSAGGCDVRMTTFNCSDKAIKYIKFYSYYKNAVDDYVPCEIRDYDMDVCSLTGPIQPNESASGTWDCVIYNRTAKTVETQWIEVDYMDGTSVSLNKEAVYALETIGRPKLKNAGSFQKEIDNERKQITDEYNSLKKKAADLVIITDSTVKKSYSYQKYQNEINAIDRTIAEIKEDIESIENLE